MRISELRYARGLIYLTVTALKEGNGLFLPVTIYDKFPVLSLVRLDGF